jgi:hypothetical protein
LIPAIQAVFGVGMFVRAKVVRGVVIVLMVLLLLGGLIALHLQQRRERDRAMDGQDDVFPLVTIASAERGIPKPLLEKLSGLEGYSVVPARSYDASYFIVWRESTTISDSALLVLESSDNDYLHIVVGRAHGGDEETLTVYLVWRRSGSAAASEDERARVWSEADRLRRDLEPLSVAQQ